MYKILIGNKCDLEDKRKISYEQGKELADQYGMKFIETSAKTAQNVTSSFETMTEEIVESNSKPNVQPKKDDTVKIGDSQRAKNLQGG